MAKTLFMMRGLPASGKSTAAKQLVDKYGNCTRVNKDDLRSMLDNGRYSKSNEQFVLKVRDFIIENALQKGNHVVVDDTNFHESHPKRLRELAKANGAQFEIKDFTHVPLETCIERDLKRLNSVGKDVIMRMYNQYLKPEVVPVEQDPFNDSCVIFDLDGTLSINDHGRDYYDASDCEKDSVNSELRLLVDYYNHPLCEKIIFLSGRSDKYEQQTRNWLNRYFPNIDYKLFMRKEGDMRKDAIVKEEIFREHVLPNYYTKLVYDDRNQVVNMWRSLGLTCFQVADGDF